MCIVSHEYRLKLARELSRISGSYCSWKKQVITPNNVKRDSVHKARTEAGGFSC